MDKSPKISASLYRYEKCPIIIKLALISLGPVLHTTGTGCTIGYSAILLPQLEEELVGTKLHVPANSELASWIASMAVLPMALGSLAGGICMERIGPKLNHILSSIPALAGWFLIYLSRDIYMLLCGRFLTGFVGGFLSAMSSVYIAESSPPRYRPLLLGLLALSIALGVMIPHAFGSFLPWRVTALICSVAPLLGFVFSCFCPPSPMWLLRAKNEGKAEDVYYCLNGKTAESEKEFKAALHTANASPKTWRLTDVLQPEFLKPLGVLLVFFTSSQFSGINAITFYTVSILRDNLGGYFDSYLAMNIVDFIRLVCSVLAVFLMKRYPRRLLAITSGLGTAVSLLLVSVCSFIFATYEELQKYSPLILLFILSYILFVSIGMVPLPWAMLGELFPSETKGLGSGLSTFTAFMAFYVVVQMAPTMFLYLGSSGTFLIYGLVATFATIFLYYFLPETKNRTLDEIGKTFKKSTNEDPPT